MLGNLIGSVITILIGIFLYPQIQVEVAKITENMTGGVANMTQIGSSTTSTIFSFLPIIFLIGMVGAGLMMAYQGLKNAGILSGFGFGKEEDEEDEEDDMEAEDDDLLGFDLEEEVEKKIVKSKPSKKWTEDDIVRSKFD